MIEKQYVLILAASHTIDSDMLWTPGPAIYRISSAFSAIDMCRRSRVAIAARLASHTHLIPYCRSHGPPTSENSRLICTKLAVQPLN